MKIERICPECGGDRWRALHAKHDLDAAYSTGAEYDAANPGER